MVKSAGDRISQLRRWAHWLRPHGGRLMVVAAGGWLLLLIFRTMLPGSWQRPIVILLALFSLLALLFPEWSEQLDGAANRLQLNRATLKILSDHLALSGDSRWRLLPHLKLPNGTELDALLIGPGGIFALSVLHSSSALQNHGHRWLSQLEDGDWLTLRRSPSRAALERAKNVQALLAAAGIAQPVTPILLWNGSTVLLLDKPAVAVWRLDDSEPVVPLPEVDDAQTMDALGQVARILQTYAAIAI